MPVMSNMGPFKTYLYALWPLTLWYKLWNTFQILKIENYLLILLYEIIFVGSVLRKNVLYKQL